MPDFLHPDKENYEDEELIQEEKIRPQNFQDFAGQRKTLDNLEVFVAAAKNRGSALDHVLLHGPPGLGKTTFSFIINFLSLCIRIAGVCLFIPIWGINGYLTGLLISQIFLFLCCILRLVIYIKNFS